MAQHEYFPLSFIKRFMLLVGSGLAICMVIFASSGLVQAYSQDDLDCQRYNRCFYNPNDDPSACSTSSDTTDSGTTNGTDTPKWVTTLQAPYNLEDFVVEVLRDIAAKEKVPETNTVTQDHVLAMIAFANGEGGNLTNDDIYNPWNTGYSAADLQPSGSHSTSGVQSYSSFNDGVEATARVMTGTGGSSGYQSRLGTVLSKANSTAQDFMKTLTYYQNYPGNLAWAEASMPPNQNSYYQGRIGLLQSTSGSYSSIASLVIGPPGHSSDNNNHTTKALRYSFAVDTSKVGASNSTTATSTDGTDCESADGGGGIVQGNIASTAVYLAWDDVLYPNKGDTDTPGHHGFQQLGIGVPQTYTKPSYQEAVAKYNPGVNSSSFTDCGVFVSTVMIASGADPNYPRSGTYNQQPYVESHPDKYQIIAQGAPLEPGDILVNGDHTYIYVGKQSDGYSVAEASQFNHSPEIDNLPYPSGFTIARLKK